MSCTGDVCRATSQPSALLETQPPEATEEAKILNRLNEREFEILIPSFILVLVVVIIGIPGNLITVWVYKVKMRRTASRIFILALAYCDLANCILTMPVEISIIINFWTFDYPVICAIGRTWTYVLNGMSALLLCGIAVDRFRKICRPLKPVFTPKRTASICFVSAAIAIAFYIPGYIIYGTFSFSFTVPYGGRNVTVTGKTCLVKNNYTESKIQKMVVGVWFLGTLAVLVVLIFAYVCIGRAIYKRLKLEEARHFSASSPSRPNTRKRILVDNSSETSCSFEDILETDRKKPPRVLKTMSVPVRHQIGESLKRKFRQSAPTVYSIKQAKVSSRIRAGRTTLMLFFVTIAYILSFIPFIVIVSIRIVKPHVYETLSDLEESAWNFFLRSYVINCAVNPLLYGFFNKDFRKKLAELFSNCVG